MFGNWEEQKRAIAQNGLHFTDLLGDTTEIKIRLGNVLEEKAQYDLVLVLVKSYQTAHVAKTAADLLHLKNPEAIILSLQNGLGNKESLEKMMPGKVFAGTTTLGARLDGLGSVIHTGDGDIALSEDCPKAIQEVFLDAGLSLRLEKDLNSIIWTKLAVNAAINPLTAMLRVKNKVLAEEETCRNWMKAICKEIECIAKRQSIQLSPKPVYPFVLSVAERTAENRSSMLSDIESGRPTEIDAICEKLIEMAEEDGIAVPFLKHAYTGVKAAELGKIFSIKDLV